MAAKILPKSPPKTPEKAEDSALDKMLPDLKRAALDLWRRASALDQPILVEKMRSQQDSGISLIRLS
jgi:hypothetical protein